MRQVVMPSCGVIPRRIEPKDCRVNGADKDLVVIVGLKGARKATHRLSWCHGVPTGTYQSVLKAAGLKAGTE
jgi:hypothetical protein